jgi:hypothetical protein
MEFVGSSTPDPIIIRGVQKEREWMQWLWFDYIINDDGAPPSPRRQAFLVFATNIDNGL